MKVLKTALLAGVSTLATTGYANADPVSLIATALSQTALFASVSYTTLYVATAIAVTAATVAISKALAPRQQSAQVDPGRYNSVFETAETSEVNAIGRVGLGGAKMFGNTNSIYRYRLIAHCKGPLIAIEKYKLGSREVVVDDGTGVVSSPPYATSSGSYVVWQTKNGDGTETAWGDLITYFSSLWTSDHKLQGIAQSLLLYISPGITTEKFGELYQGGEPEPTIVARVNTAYDPREVGHDPDDESTWEWTDNGVLCAARIMLSYPDLTVDSFDWDFIADEADRADATVSTLTGTEARSRCSGVWLSEANRGDTMQQVLDSIGAEVVMSEDDLIRIRLIDDDPTTEMTIVDADNDIIEWSWKSGPEAVERPNVCRIRYYSSERNYQMAEIDMSGIGWATITDEVTRYGEKVFDVELTFCPSASQAQRIARRLFLLARGDAGMVRTNMVGKAAWGLTYVSLTMEELGTFKARIAPPRDDDSGQVEIPFVAWPSDLLTAWNPATMEAAAPDEIPDLQYTATLSTPAAPIEVQVVQYPGGGSYETRIRFATVSGGVTAEANYRYYPTEFPTSWASMVEYAGTGTRYHAYVSADFSGVEMDFRVRWFDADGEASYFSDLLNATAAINNLAPSAPPVVDDVTTDGGGVPTDIQLTITVPELRVVKLVVETQRDSEGWLTHTTINDVRPDVAEVVDITCPSPNVDDILFQWRVSTFTSNDTQSPYTSGSETIPGTGGP